MQVIERVSGRDDLFGRLLAERTQRPLFVAVALITLAVLLAYPILDWWLRTAGIAPQFQFWDFGAYGGAVERWRAGDPLYLTDESGGFHGSYLYPPIVLLVFIPFLLQPVVAPPVAWTVVTFGLLWVGLQLVITELGVTLRRYERGVLLWLLFGFHPLLFSLKMGQTSALLGAMVCFAYVGLSRATSGHHRWGLASGAITAGIGVTKPAYAPVGAHLLADRERLIGAVVTGLVLSGLSIGLFGFAVHRQFIDVLIWGIGQGSSARSPALWLPGYFRPFVWVPDGAVALRVTIAATIAGAALLVDESGHELVFALGVVAFPLITPLSYTYYLVAVLPGAIVLVANELQRQTGGRPVVPVLGVLLAGCHAYGLKLLVDGLAGTVPPWGLGLLQPGLWGAGLLGVLAYVRVTEHTALPPWVVNQFSSSS